MPCAPTGSSSEVKGDSATNTVVTSSGSVGSSGGSFPTGAVIGGAAAAAAALAAVLALRGGKKKKKRSPVAKPNLMPYAPPSGNSTWSTAGVLIAGILAVTVVGTGAYFLTRKKGKRR